MFRASLGAAYFFDKGAEEGISAANERAGLANESAGRANERAAQLEKDAAIARARANEAELKLEQIRKKVAPRTLKREDFITALKGQPSAPTEVLYLRDDAESFEFAQEIALAMEAAGWQVNGRRPIPPTSKPDAISSMEVGGQPSGVTVVAPEITDEEMESSENRLLGKPWVKTPWTVLTNALGDSLGIIAASAGGPNPPHAGTLRVVVAPKGTR